MTTPGGVHLLLEHSIFVDLFFPRRRLIELREMEMANRYPDTDRSHGLLRKTLLTRLLESRPTTRQEFVSVIPESLRATTDIRQIEDYLDTVLDTLKQIKQD